MCNKRRLCDVLELRQPAMQLNKQPQHQQQQVIRRTRFWFLIHSIRFMCASLVFNPFSLSIHFLFLESFEVQKQQKNENRMQVNRKMLSWILICSIRCGGMLLCRILNRSTRRRWRELGITRDNPSRCRFIRKRGRCKTHERTEKKRITLTHSEQWHQ